MIGLQLLGPTGVGKTHWGKVLAESLGLLFQDLDALIAPPYGAEQYLMQHGVAAFWQQSLWVLEDLQRHPETYVVAVGAGTQWAACEMDAVFQLLQYPTCTLWCEPTSLLLLLQKYRQDPRSLAQLLAMEYTKARSELYLRAQDYVDRSALSEQQLRLTLTEIARKQQLSR